MFCIENLKCLILPVDRKMWLQPESQMMKCKCILLDVITNLLLCKRATWFIEPSDWGYLKWLQLGYWTKPYIGRSTYTHSGLQDYKDKKKTIKKGLKNTFRNYFDLADSINEISIYRYLLHYEVKKNQSPRSNLTSQYLRLFLIHTINEQDMWAFTTGLSHKYLCLSLILMNV